MELSHCYYCNKDKPKMLFYKKSYRKCKECKYKDNCKWKAENLDRARESARLNARKHRIANAAAYRKRGNEYYKKWYRTKGQIKARERVKEWREKNPLKPKIHLLVKLMVDFGLLTRPDKCSNCPAETRLDAHHPDYSKPIDVIWLCRSCHLSLHRGWESPQII